MLLLGEIQFVFVSCLLSFCCPSCCQFRFWWLYSVFLRVFQCSSRVVVSMRQTLSSMLASLLPPSFVDTYSLSTSSLWCYALYMVISFLVLWSICLSSSLVHFKKGSRISNEGYSLVIYSFDKVLAREFCLE